MATLFSSKKTTFAPFARLGKTGGSILSKSLGGRHGLERVEYPPQGQRRETRWSQIGQQLSRPLTFRDSVWLSEPEKLMLQLQFANKDEAVLFDPPHHILSRSKKKQLVYLVSLAAMFSPLSSNIYFPALTDIAESLNTSIALVALTVSIYMVFQGLAPSFWGPLADSYGRRPIFLSTLFVYFLANIALAQSKSFAMLMLFRGIQAIGSSSTIAIGAGVIGDIALGSERGGFMGLFGGIRMFGQAIGPVFGGILTQYLGFRSIFYFLTCFAAVVVIMLALYLPETLRKIAGDGSRRLYGIYRPILSHSNQGTPIPVEERYTPSEISLSTLLESFKLLAEKDVLTHQGFGCVLGSLITGKLMDRDYKKEAVRYTKEHALPEDIEPKQQNYPDFPIERARLRSVYFLNGIFVIATGVYGFSVEWHIAIPLILQFITAFTATAIFNINSTLMIDLYPSKPASATAINNLVRCTLGAIGVGFIQKSINTIKEGPTFLALALIALASIVLVVIARKWGPQWRMERFYRLKSLQELAEAVKNKG
ncbi:MFS general substrate transporter [Venturia nashicola]|uniref:MFS general substrate transporter n=1 Tax=Venturia nashicola TaxID=86259 RepID=A0A4Z1PNX9_9PEZI|nr:MFS general substrate transporter [Venturia nashicola]